MRDPVERMVKFVTGQKEQAVCLYARQEWAQRLPTLVSRVQEVMAVFHGGLEEAEEGPVASVQVDPRHERCPLVIAFERRRCEDDRILSLHPERPPMEAGASAVFRCETDGVVYGFRYPFHGVLRDLRPERFVDLGEPSAVEADALANAVADFLEWASVGAGSGSRKLRFWSPPAQLDRPQRTIQLRVAAA